MVMRYHWGCGVGHSYCHPSEPQHQSSATVPPSTPTGTKSKGEDDAEPKDTWHNVQMEDIDADAELKDTDFDMDPLESGESEDSVDDEEDDWDSDFQGGEKEEDEEDMEDTGYVW